MAFSLSPNLSPRGGEVWREVKTVLTQARTAITSIVSSVINLGDRVLEVAVAHTPRRTVAVEEGSREKLLHRLTMRLYRRTMRLYRRTMRLYQLTMRLY
ncbi:hypothetical protein [Nostoc sp.]|uniref:hypothetical protein n=1 Tax=Nostoc sp. TaxID=1180 RepID=UPI002FFA060F